MLAADAYRAAREDGRTDLTVAVAKTCGVSRATAARRIQRAIDEGILSPKEAAQ